MAARLDRLPAESGSRREFLRTYRRTTAAVGAAVEAGGFEDARSTTGPAASGRGEERVAEPVTAWYDLCIEAPSVT